MKRDEAEKLIDSLTDAAQECECAEFLNDFKLSESASKKIDKLRAKLLAALAPETSQPDALTLAKLFHDTYERLAPRFGYNTKVETRVFDENTPNGKLMVAVCEIVAGHWRKVKP